VARQIHDVTRPIFNQMPVWPGDPPVIIERVSGEPGDDAAISSLKLSTHTGTHVDAPAHFIPAGETVDRLHLDLLLGPAWVVYLEAPAPISAAALEAASIPEGVERLLIRTQNSEPTGLERPGFDEDFVALTRDAAMWVASRGFRLVGIDGPGIGLYGQESTPVHQILLGAGVIPLEGLNLAEIEPGAYDLVCLPLRIEDGDGAPARVLLIRDP
jgi:arylformamidase